MRNAILFRTFFILIAANLFACSKNTAGDASHAAAVNNEAARKVIAWLDSKLAKSNSSDKQEKVKAIKRSLNLYGMWTEECDNSESFILVPLKDDLPSAHNKERQKKIFLS